MALNLMLHCGGAAVEKADLDLVPIPPSTERWTPIGHSVFVEEVTNAMDAANMVVVDEAHALTKDGDRYFGMMELRAPNEGSEYSTVIGLRNSLDKSFSAQLVMGNRVFVCDNLAFAGEIKIARKHTRWIMRDLPNLIQGAIARVPMMERYQAMRIERYKERDITPMEADNVIMEMWRDKIIAPSRIAKVWSEWVEPSAEGQFDNDDWSAWRMFNAATAALKGTGLSLPTTTMKLHGLMDDVCDVEPIRQEAA